MSLLNAAGRTLSYEWVGEERGRPPLVFLHEGLGSSRRWREFAVRLAEASGRRALVYDRYGYGRSDVLREQRRPVKYMHEEALVALPDVVRYLGIERPILVGHSDGASIALIYAGAGHDVAAVAAIAPHVFIESVSLISIRKATQAFETTDLAEKLARHHVDAHKTFYGWADVWLDPEFKSWDIRDDYLPKVRCPVLAMQGHDDEYGTMAQLDEIARRVGGRCQLEKLERCGHSPFRDQPEQTLQVVSAFVKGLK